jgi:hypothetical protein
MDLHANIQYYKSKDGLFAVLNYHEFERYLTVYSLSGGLEEIQANYLYRSKRLYKNNKALIPLKVTMQKLGFKYI